MDEKVKDILEKVKLSATAAGEFAASTAEAAGKRAGEVVEVTKLNLQIFDLNNEISALFKQIGELVYKAHDNADADTSSIEEWLALIDEKKNTVSEIKQRILGFKHSKKCPNPECGRDCEKNDTFCPRCGTQL